MLRQRSALKSDAYVQIMDLNRKVPMCTPQDDVGADLLPSSIRKGHGASGGFRSGVHDGHGVSVSAQRNSMAGCNLAVNAGWEQPAHQGDRRAHAGRPSPCSW
jgi:hypothetical protein